MKPNDIVMIYTSPVKCEQPEGQAKLIMLIDTFNNLEDWEVEFLDQPNQIYQRLIKV